MFDRGHPGLLTAGAPLVDQGECPTSHVPAGRVNIAAGETTAVPTCPTSVLPLGHSMMKWLSVRGSFDATEDVFGTC